MPKFQIEELEISSIQNNPNNPRTHNQRQIAKLRASIATFGFMVPVLVDECGQLISGQARTEAARQLGMTSIPAIRVQHLTVAEKHAYMLADNRLAQLASWNEEALRNELKFLADLDIDFDFSAIGFETAEIDLILEPAAPTDNKDDVLPTISIDAPIVSEPGDLWYLGEHRLFCGNALEPASYAKLLETARACVITADPPYNVPIDGHAVGLGRVKHREFAMASGEMTPDQFKAFLITTAKHLMDNSIDGSLHYIFMDWRHCKEILAAGESVYTELKNICVWNKTNAGMGSFYRSQHEFIFVFKNGRAPHINNIELGAHGRYRTNVWDYAGINSFGRARDALLALHPTVKPVALIADILQDCSKRGDLVLDAFGGSGTTLIAAEKTKRRAALIEIDPLYVDATIRRWQTYTGQAAICAKTGIAFEERERLSRAQEVDSAATAN
jgi:DNA modification methylase